ncbi:hypothetical protein JCM8097_007318 [Rhodosporidiobolus ruineniae]
MQLRLPRDKNAPPRRKRAPIVSTADSPPCGICHKQLSHYTCPSCNLPYCSLACFKAPDHAACQERFAQQTLSEDLKGGPRADGQGEEGMLRMLREFEERQRELEELEQGDGEEEEDEEEDDTEEGRARRAEREELEKRLAGVDLDALSPDDLLALLSPQQQAAFQSTLSDPAQATKLVADQFEGDEPWWIVEEERKVLKELREGAKEAARKLRAEQGGDGGEVEEDGEESEEEEEDVRPPTLDPAVLPPMKKAPDGQQLAGAKLLYNVVAVVFAYSYTLRTFALTSFSSLPEKSTERIAAIQVLAQLLPFLVERSTDAVENLEGAVEYVVARENPSRFSPELVAMLLHDLASLLRPAPITAISPASSSSPLASHSLATALAALSDLYHLFAAALASSTPSASSASSASNGPTISRPLIARPSTTSPLDKKQKQQCTLAAAKLLFYAALLVADSKVADACKGVAELAETEAERREKEREMEDKARKRRKEGIGRREEREAVQADEPARPPKIVEL